MDLILYVAIGICALLLITVIILLTVIRSNNKTARLANGRYAANPEKPAAGSQTEVINNPSHAPSDGIPCICLRNAGNAEQIWDMAITNEILIGRDTNCRICLDERSVSRQQCRIYYNDAAMAENLSNSNITLLNGEPLSKPAPINTGDKIKCGRLTLIVDLLYSGDSQNVGDLSKGTVYINI